MKIYLVWDYEWIHDDAPISVLHSVWFSKEKAESTAKELGFRAFIVEQEEGLYNP